MPFTGSPDALSCRPPGLPGEAIMLADSPIPSGRCVALLAGLAIAFTACPIACGGRTSDLGDGGTSGGSSGGGSGSSGGGSGGGSGGFPYSGPSCSNTTITPACWSCMQSDCPALVTCISSTCTAYFDCYCPCPFDDSNCVEGCQASITSSCESCIDGSESCLETTCAQACETTMTGGGSSSGGTSPSSECSGSSQPCANGQFLDSCQNLDNGQCTSAYYQVGSQTFPCASCTDTTGCQQQATAACQ
jgi:hypothetical protein